MKDLFAQPIPANWYTEEADTCFARSCNGEGSLYCPNCGNYVSDIWRGDKVPKKVDVICDTCRDLFVPNEQAELENSLGTY